MNTQLYRIAGAAITLSTLLLGGCSSEAEPEAFSLEFAAVAGDKTVGCTDVIDGLGPDGNSSLQIADLRFYISNIVMRDKDGEPLEVTLDDNAFQYNGAAGSVALIDLTSNSEGGCVAGAPAASEGTARTNTSVSGKTLLEDVASVSFEIGVPQPLMKEIIAGSTPEAAPSPLNEMYWSWASGYRHFVLNASVETPEGVGGGFLHIGSRDCGKDGELALEGKDSCGFVNTPRMDLAGFDLSADRITINIAKLVDGLDFLSPIRDPETHEVIGDGPGVECHSSPKQDDCSTIFQHLGIDMSNGNADAAKNEAFVWSR